MPRSLNAIEIEDLRSRGIVPGATLYMLSDVTYERTFTFKDWNDLRVFGEAHTYIWYDGFLIKSHLKYVRVKEDISPLLKQIKLELRHLPIGAQELLMIRCQEQGVKSLADFNYGNAPEGSKFWLTLISLKNVQAYYDRYPIDDDVNVIPEDIRRRIERNRIRLPYANARYYKFYWADSEEGVEFWSLVHDGAYDQARDLLAKKESSEQQIINQQIVKNQSTQEDGKPKVQRPVATVISRERQSGIAIQGRRSPSAITGGSISHQAVIGY